MTYMCDTHFNHLLLFHLVSHMYMYTVPGENFEVYILHNKIVNCNEIKYNCDGTASIVFLIILENFNKNVENFTFNFED